MSNSKSDSIEIKIPNFTKKIRKNPWMVSTAVLLLLAVLLLISSTNNCSGNVINSDEAGQVILAAFNSQIPGSTIELVSSEAIGSSLYNVVLSIDGQLGTAYVTRDGEYLIQEIIPLEVIAGGENDNSNNPPSNIEGSTFLATGDSLCADDEGKPYVILFTTTWCPHCNWIGSTFESLATGDLADKINLQHWEIDTGDNALTSEVETEVPADMLALYQKYNPQGSIPTFVFGCEYFRIGNGYESQDDLNAELEDFENTISLLLE